MGKFTFAVPTRRNKQQQQQQLSSTSNVQLASPGAPMGLSKAHQILGGGGNNGTPILAATYRQWDDGNHSGAVSDSHHNTATDMRGSDRIRHGDGEGSRAVWEAESDTIPLHTHKGNVDPHNKSATTGADLNSTQPDDPEMLRRMESSASLDEWYDKTKLPLSISQQTSASAMAKGLPHKASVLLDMDNISPTQSTFAGKLKKKKKQHGIDISGLFHRKRGKSIENGALEGMDAGGGSALPAPIRQGPRHWRKNDQSSQQQQQQQQQKEMVRPHTSESEVKRRPGDMAHMERMYRHYEAATHRDNPDEVDAPPPVPPIPDNIRIAVDPAAAWASVPTSQPQTPLTRPPLSRGSSRPSDVTSISSRQTRESKHTLHSARFDTDIKLTSVLSLSSSSEASDNDEDDDDDDGDDEEMVEGVQAFLLEASRGAGSDYGGKRMMSDYHSHGELPGGLVPSTRSNRYKRESYASTDTYLTVPSQAASKKSKSTAPSSQGSPWAAKAQSRLSMMSTSTTASSASWASTPARRAYPAPANSPPNMALPKPPPQRSNTQRDGKRLASASSVACLNRPSMVGKLATGSSIRTSQSHQQLSPSNSHESSRSPWDNLAHPTPPLTPAAVEAFIRSAAVGSNPNSVASTPIEMLRSDGDSFMSSDNRDSMYNPRFMAVTRQEELLLAALRQKRVHMHQNEFLTDDSVNAIVADLGVGEQLRRSDSRSSRVPKKKNGPLSRSSTQTLTEKSLAGNIQPQDGDVYKGRKRGSAASSQRSSATVMSRTPRGDASTISPMSSRNQLRNNSTISQDVPLFLDESSMPDVHRMPSSSRLQSFSRPRPPPLSTSASTVGSRSSSRAPPPLSTSIAEDDILNLDGLDFEGFEEDENRPATREEEEHAGDDDDDEGAQSDEAGSESDGGDTAFMFPVPGGRGSINVGIITTPSSRSASMRKLSGSLRSAIPHSPSRAVSFGNARRGTINEPNKLAIPEDEVHNATSDDMWPPIAPLPAPPINKDRRGSCDVPRPDSPPLAPDEVMRKKKTAARLSAVGGRSGEPGWWGHDG